MATSDEMDTAAKTASEDLARIRAENPEAVALMVEWWKRHYLGAGHKRLGRVLLGRPAGARDRE